ncbi:MAG: preprotein translocase subunit SecG [Crocinitomicaceae bacterium]|nr:preprotein translocase subunit SecG [Crocinitomicaceae bacterium]|tara:strand:- start:1246 stop:1596 length:351 start_codon:yes stop_codon:yes gene_type:complete
MGTFLTVIILIICFLLGAVILVQNPKGGGLASGFTGGSQMGGVQRTTDFLVKSTWYLVVALFVFCILAGVYNGNKTVDLGIDDALIPEAAVPTQKDAPAESLEESMYNESTEEMAE